EEAVDLPLGQHRLRGALAGLDPVGELRQAADPARQGGALRDRSLEALLPHRDVEAGLGERTRERAERVPVERLRRHRAPPLLEELLGRVTPADRRLERRELRRVDLGDRVELATLLRHANNGRSTWRNRKYARVSRAAGQTPLRNRDGAPVGVGGLDPLALDELLECGDAARAELAACMLVQLAQRVLVVSRGL